MRYIIIYMMSFGCTMYCEYCKLFQSTVHVHDILR